MPPQTVWGPVNIQQGNSAFFTAEFYDSSGNTTTPTGATLAVSYTNLNNLSQTDSFTMAASGSFYTATWSSASASRGLASWTVTATGNSTAAQNGQIRVIDP